MTRLSKGFQLAIWLFVIFLAPAGLFAQQFESVQPLYFTRAFDKPDPLPQILPMASTGANFIFSVASSTSNGGNWLSTSPTGSECCETPHGVSVIVTTALTLGVGTYNGQVTLTAGGSITPLTVPVTLVITAASGTFFDNTPGQISFSMLPNGNPPSQVLQIRNAGTGSLNWSLTTSTFNSQSWLSVSATSGTAPSVITVSIVPANLPNGGVTPGTYGGQLLFQTPGGASIVTIPVGITVATNAMPQVNALSFTKPFDGANPLPQTVTIAHATTSFVFTVASSTSNGSTSGSWLSASPTGNECCSSAKAITITVAPTVTLAAGTYTGQVTADNGTQLMVIPVTLQIGASGTAFFDNMAGQLSFSLQASAANSPPPQLLQIRGAGTGALAWNLTIATCDSGNWITASATSGTAPTQISISVVPSSLPDGGVTAGVFTANLLFQGAGTSITVPITVQVGNVFEQVNGLSFTMLAAGPDPLPQNIAIATPGTNFVFSVSAFTATGGNWLSVTPSGNECCATPRTLEVSITAPLTMPAGTYTGQIVVYSGTTSMTVPVTLTVQTATQPYFDNLPGELTFEMATGATNGPSNQVFQIRNAGSGTLNWTLTPVTGDGGNWLTVSATNGAAPALITVGIVPGNLPNGGLEPGYFVGQLLLQSQGSMTTIPVSVSVNTTVFGQLNGINFTMQQGGASPLPQVLTATSTGTAFVFSVSASSATGGNWLSVSPNGNACCSTPEVFTVTVTAPPTMPAGTYTGQVSFYSGNVSQNIPVTLTIAPASTAFFDNVPGALSYSLLTQAGNPPSQNVQIRNFGSGTLTWTAQTFTGDGGNWLTISATSGTAPSIVSVGVITANLPSAGLEPGQFTGQVLFLAGSSSVTVPVNVIVGGNGFLQINPLDFSMPLTGASPLPQTLITTAFGTNFVYTASAVTSNGGNWLTVSPNGNACCSNPEVEIVTITAPPTMAAGTYTGELIFNGTRSAAVVPVNLTISPLTGPFFDNLQGQMSFFAATNTTPASQNILVENAGEGQLNFSVTPITADGGQWLVPSVTNATAPANISVSIVPANLPNQDLLAGQFGGQLLLQANGSAVSVPVLVQVGPNTFTPQAPLNFSMAYGGASPLNKTLSVTSTGTAFVYSTFATAANGGNWLSASPFGNACCSTPATITMAVNGAPSGTPVTAGIHTGQVLFDSTRSAMTVPVILSVSGTPKWSIAKHHTGNFTAGQNGATYTVTVSNSTGASVGITNGTATVTETVPAGMTLVSMQGNNWTCPSNPGNTCTRSDSLAAGNSYDPITVTVNIASTVSTPLTNSVSVTGGGSVQATATDQTLIITKCDIDKDGYTDVADLQSLINQALGIVPVTNDFNQDGSVNLIDVQIAVNSAIGRGCAAM